MYDDLLGMYCSILEWHETTITQRVIMFINIARDYEPFLSVGFGIDSVDNVLSSNTPPVETAGFQVDQGTQYCTKCAMLGNENKTTRTQKPGKVLVRLHASSLLPPFELTIRASRAEPNFI